MPIATTSSHLESVLNGETLRHSTNLDGATPIAIPIKVVPCGIIRKSSEKNVLHH